MPPLRATRPGDHLINHHRRERTHQHPHRHRIEIRSPGSLPGHITVENMRDDHYSRNRRMMRTLKLVGLVEEYGEGVDRMFTEMEARLMEPPLFTATPSSVSVVIRNRFLVDVEDQVWLAPIPFS